MEDRSVATHACIVCPARGRDIPDLYETANVCASCRNWLAGLPADICRLWARLGDHTIEPDAPWYVDQYRDGRWVRELGHDPIAGAMPTTASGARIGGDHVSGSREAPMPINVEMVDLTLPARRGSVAARVGDHWQDQDGNWSVAMTLDLVVRAWVEHRGQKHLPVPTVPVLADWITAHTDWACDNYPGVDEDAADLRRLHGLLRSVLGETEQRPERMGAPCPGCDMLTLIRRPGDDKVECANEDCRRVLTADEYARWCGLVAAAERERRAEVTCEAP